MDELDDAIIELAGALQEAVKARRLEGADRVEHLGLARRTLREAEELIERATIAAESGAGNGDYGEGGS